MKTVCIKTNNSKAINYLLENLNCLNLDDVYFSCHKFNLYTNIFIHYKGKNLELFLSSISHILVFLVFDLFENIITKKIFEHEYFYFDNIEKSQILEITENNLVNNIETFTNKENILFNIFYNFLKKEDILYLQGFLAFRSKKYINELENVLEEAINEYLIEKEYSEFVSLLRLYINSEPSGVNLVHLIYLADNPILLDENKNIIKIDMNIFNAKYLSDISFSSLDMVLNTLLNLLPKKIYIHLIDKEPHEFIDTLNLIFENRVVLCDDCNICRIYKAGRNKGKIKER